MPIQVFISHSHEDRTLSEAVVDLLNNTLGLRDEQILNTSNPATGLRAGSDVSGEIKQAMDSAVVSLVLITQASGERQWVEFEVGAASIANKRIYTLLHPSAKSPPPTLPNIPTLIHSDEEVAKLIDAIREDLKLDAMPSTVKTIQAISRFIAEVKAYNPEYTILHYQNRLELQIGYGDVLDWPGPGAIVLPCDNRFDLVKYGERSQLYDHTLVGQYRRRFLSHLDTDEFRARMAKRLGGSNLNAVFEVGHVSVTPLAERPGDRSDPRMLFLVVLQTVMDRGGFIEAAADAPDVWRAYENLWKEVAQQRPEAVAVPLFGSGMSGTLLSQQQSCALAVLSAVCVALRQPIYPRLWLLCHSRERYRALDLRAIAQAAGLERGPRN